MMTPAARAAAAMASMPVDGIVDGDLGQEESQAHLDGQRQCHWWAAGRAAVRKQWSSEPLGGRTGRGAYDHAAHLPVEQPQEPLSHLHVGPQGHPEAALAEQQSALQPHLPSAQPQSPSVQAQPGPQVQGIQCQSSAC